MISTMRLSLGTLQLYTDTWTRVMQKDAPTDDDITEFFDMLPVLRDTLSCTACCNLLTVTGCLSTDNCDHYVCKDCQGKKRDEKRTCQHCQDWSAFLENDTLKQLLEGYKQFCRLFLKRRKYNLHLENKHNTDPSFDAFAALDILQEGARRPPRGIQEQSTNVMSKSPSRKNVAVESRPLEQRQVMQVIYQKQEDEDSIDIKIEPIYQDRFHEGSSTTLEMQIEEDSNESIDQRSPTQSPMEPSSGGEQEISCDMEEDGYSSEERTEEIETMAEMQTEEPAEPISRIVEAIPLTTSTSPSTSSITFQLPLQQQTPATTTTATGVSIGGPISMSSSSAPIMHISPRQFPLHSFVLTRPSMSNVSASSSYQVQSFGGSGQTTVAGGRQFPIGLGGPQTIRLARFSLPDGRPLTMVRQVLNNQGQTITLPINTADLMQKKIIVRPATTGGNATTSQLQRWPDPNAVLQYATGSSSSVIQQQGGTTQYKIATTSSNAHQNIGISSQSGMVVSTSTGGLVFNTASGSILNYAGGAKPGTRFTLGSGGILQQNSISIGNTSVQIAGSSQSATMISDATQLKVRFPKSKQSQQKARTGCRCGNAATQPGKLTCCGQRCPCYTMQKSCAEGDCKCKGCRNPHLSNGKKLMQGLNAVIDTKTNQTISFSPSSSVSSVGSSSSLSRVSPVVTTSIKSSSSTISSTLTSINSVNLTSSGGGGPPTLVSSTVQSQPGPSHQQMNFLPITSSAGGLLTGINSPQMFTRIHQPGTPQTNTFSQLIPLSNFAGFSIPISLISPANSTLQQHGETIHLQNVHHMNLNNE